MRSPRRQQLRSAVADLMTAWTSAKVLLPMTVEVPREADALSVGWAVAGALGGGDCASVEAEPVPAPGAPSPGIKSLTSVGSQTLTYGYIAGKKPRVKGECREPEGVDRGVPPVPSRP